MSCDRNQVKVTGVVSSADLGAIPDKTAHVAHQGKFKGELG